MGDGDVLSVIARQHRPCRNRDRLKCPVVKGEGPGCLSGVLVAVSRGRDGLGFGQGERGQQLAQRGGAVQPDGVHLWRNGDGRGRGHERDELGISQITHDKETQQQQEQHQGRR